MKEIESILRDFNVLTSNINLDRSVENIIKDVESMLIRGCLVVKDQRKLLAALWKMDRQINIDQICNNDIFKNRIREILKSDFTLNQNFIFYNEFIPPSVVQLSSGIKILTDRQSNELINMGYGITQFKINKGLKIQDIFCEGKHPNVNNNTRCLCADSDLLNLELTLHNLILVKEMLSQFNLRNHFVTISEAIKIKEVLS